MFFNLVGGRQVESRSGRRFVSDNLFTGKPWCEIPQCKAADVDVAVEAAHAAFSSGRCY